MKKYIKKSLFTIIKNMNYQVTSKIPKYSKPIKSSSLYSSHPQRSTLSVFKPDTTMIIAYLENSADFQYFCRKSYLFIYLFIFQNKLCVNHLHNINLNVS